MLNKEVYNRNRDTIVQYSKIADLIGGEEWNLAKRYFNVLKNRDQIPYAPSKRNAYMCPTYAEMTAYNKDKIDGRTTRRPQNEWQVREAMMEAGIEEDKIDKTFEILKRMGQEKK